MTLEGVELSFGLEVPQADNLIGPAGESLLAVGGDGDTEYDGPVLEVAELPAAISIPEPDGRVMATR
jgi:hypothetical protein